LKEVENVGGRYSQNRFLDVCPTRSIEIVISKVLASSIDVTGGGK